VRENIGVADQSPALGELAVAQALAGQTAQADASAAEAESLLEGLTSPEDAGTVEFIRGRLQLARGKWRRSNGRPLVEWLPDGPSFSASSCTG
jgi:hypothetical protein